MRLIDADIVYNAIKHLKEKYWHYKTATNSQFTNDCLRYIEKQLNKAPTIDAVPAVHGTWVAFNAIDTKDFSSKIRYMCNKCGRYEDEKEPYCNCGAKMNGDEEK